MACATGPACASGSQPRVSARGASRSQYDYVIKLLLIGDSGVGKSCLLLRFADEAFTTQFITTIGIDFKVKTIELDGKRVKLQIWDTAGQERFRTITNAYYRGANGIVLVYDVTDEQSFLNVANWVRNINQHASETVVRQLVGNKCDIEGERVVSYSRGEALAKANKMRFFETSAKADHNVTECFYTLAKDVKDMMNSLRVPPVFPDPPIDLHKEEVAGNVSCCK